MRRQSKRSTESGREGMTRVRSLITNQRRSFATTRSANSKPGALRNQCMVLLCAANLVFMVATLNSRFTYNIAVGVNGASDLPDSSSSLQESWSRLLSLGMEDEDEKDPADKSCKTVSIIDSWKARAPELAKSLKVTQLPTKKEPFFYFHLRKAGGSTLRNLIGQAADENGLSHWIPCYKRPCMPFSIPPGESRFEIYASHLEYTVAMKMLKEVEFSKVATQNFQRISIPRTESNTTIELDRFVGDPPHSCMTRLRPTVDRVASCWNFVAVQNHPMKDNPPAHEIHADDWPTALQSVDCNNEIVRMFGSVTEPSYIGAADMCDGTAHQDMEKILERMSHCVITHNERCEESKEIVDVFLPWMKNSFLCDAKANQGKVKKKALTGDASDAILMMNEYDQVLFEFGEALFEEQLKQARAIKSDQVFGSR